MRKAFALPWDLMIKRKQKEVESLRTFSYLRVSLPVNLRWGTVKRMFRCVLVSLCWGVVVSVTQRGIMGALQQLTKLQDELMEVGTYIMILTLTHLREEEKRIVMIITKIGS